jgi:hypothetical protein
MSAENAHLPPGVRKVDAALLEPGSAVIHIQAPITEGAHVMNAFKDLGVNSRIELARVYVAHGEAAD